MDTSKLKFKAEIMDENAMKRALRRIAHEIILPCVFRKSLFCVM
mgnify:CR=1 FL=1